MAPTQAADVLLVNGRIWTGRPEDDTRRLSALAVAGNRIAMVGSDDDVRPLSGAGSRIIDLRGRRVIPGLIDSHLHAIRAGLTYELELDWTDVSTLATALESVEQAASERPPGTWITVLGGWHPTQLDAGRLPAPAELDAVAPEHPVFIHPLYAHEDVAVLNTVAMVEMGWGDGYVSGMARYASINAVALRPTTEEEDRSTRAFFNRLAALGLTGLIDPAGLGMSPDRYRAVHDVWRRGELPLRVRTLHGAVTPGGEAEEVARWQQYLHPGQGDGLLAVLGVGEAVHYGCHDWEGMDPFTIDDTSWRELLAVARRCASAGWPLSVHAILDSSVSRVLDALEIVDRERPLRPLRFSLCHAECIRPANIERMARLGVGLTVQGRMAQKAAVAAARWGADILRHAPPLGDLVRAGIPIGAGTDGTRSASYNPWLTIWWLVTGRVLDGGPRRDPQHCLSRPDALRAFTQGSAWFSFEEHERGELSPGRLADLAALSDDVMTVAEEAIPHITSDLTMVDGRVVHATGEFADVPVERHSVQAAPAEW